MATIANVTHRDPDILSGSLVFIGTRVSVRSLFDYLGGGKSLNEFFNRSSQPFFSRPARSNQVGR